MLILLVMRFALDNPWGESLAVAAASSIGAALGQYVLNRAQERKRDNPIR